MFACAKKEAREELRTREIVGLVDEYEGAVHCYDINPIYISGRCAAFILLKL